MAVVPVFLLLWILAFVVLRMLRQLLLPVLSVLTLLLLISLLLLRRLCVCVAFIAALLSMCTVHPSRHCKNGVL